MHIRAELTFVKWKARMMICAVRQASLLCEMSQLEDKKIEPEQLRKNIATIQSILHDTEDILSMITHSSDSDY